MARASSSLALSAASSLSAAMQAAPDAQLSARRVCYLCSAPSLTPIARHVDFGLPIRVCAECGLAQTDPVPPEFLDAYYRHAYGEDHGRADSASYVAYCERRGRAQAAFIHEASGGRRFESILDFGGGPGGALAAFAGHGVRLIGCEPDPQMRAIMAARPHVEDVTQTALLSGAFDGQFDLIILSHVLEHLTDPTFELAKLRRLLRADGALFVETPAETADVLPELTERLRLGAGHIFHFSAETLSRVISADRLYDVVALRRCGVALPDLLSGAAQLDPDANAPVADGVWLRALAKATERDPAFAAPRTISRSAGDPEHVEALHSLSRARNALLRVTRKAYATLLRATPRGAHQASAMQALPFNAAPTSDLTDLAEATHRTILRRREMLAALRVRLNEQRAKTRRVLERNAELEARNKALKTRAETAELASAEALRAKEQAELRLARARARVERVTGRVQTLRALNRTQERTLKEQSKELARLQNSRALRLGRSLLRPLVMARAVWLSLQARWRTRAQNGAQS